MTDTAGQASAGDAAAAPGWYPDPMSDAHERWWSGIGWTEYQQPIPVIEPPAAHALPEIVVPIAEPLALTEGPAAPEPAVPRFDLTGFDTSSFDESRHATGVPGAGSPTRGFGNVYEIAAPPPENTFVRKGTLYAILAVAINILMIPSIGSIFYGAKGLTRATEIEAMGYPRTQSRRTGARLILAAGIVGTAFSLIAGGSALYASFPHYDRVAVQSAVSTDVLAQVGNPAVVTCPASAPFTAGSSFDCSVGFADGSTVWAVVRVTDTRGGYTWTYETQASGVAS